MKLLYQTCKCNCVFPAKHEHFQKKKYYFKAVDILLYNKGYLLLPPENGVTFFPFSVLFTGLKILIMLQELQMNFSV